MKSTFKKNPELWKEYHATRKANFANTDPDSIPSNMVIRDLEKIKTKRTKIVVDMGCGEAPIAKHFDGDSRFTFRNFDHQSGGDSMIEEVDISQLPLEDNSVEIAIISLALWGTRENKVKYITEAYRVLETGGKLYIVDSTKKWSPDKVTKDNAGSLLRELLIANKFKILDRDEDEDVQDVFCKFTCSKN
jgi:SAM-dependent methyltransferase